MPRGEAGPRAVAGAILRWYAGNARDLPWRRGSDPYRVLVSEVMLQQTTVETVAPRFEAFVAAYPDFRSLAAASEEEVLCLWSGLGYYRRGRNLLAAARAVVERHEGQLPEDPRALRRLPGVGPYTAAALGAILHGRSVLALDGNLRRVLSRLIALREDPWSRKGEAALRRAGERILAAGGDPSALNQALMDIGASVCSPREPRCPACPLRAHCGARRRGLAGAIPAPRRRPAVVHVALQAWVIRRGGRVLMRRRRGALMAGMWEFPVFQAEGGAGGARLGAEARRRIASLTGVTPAGAERRGVFGHAITRHRLRVEVFVARAARAGGRRGGAVEERDTREGPARIAGPLGRGDLRWVEVARLASLPLTGIARKVLSAISPHVSSFRKASI